MIPGGCATSGYHNPEVAQPPVYDIWVSYHYHYEKNAIISAKTKKNLKIFWGVTQEPMKKPELKHVPRPLTP